MAEVRIEHRYPDALAFVRRHGPEALVVLHDLLAHARCHDDGRLVVQASTRQIAAHLELLSKDTVHRRLRQLHRAAVLRLVEDPSGRFAVPTYVLDLDGTGISLQPETAPPTPSRSAPAGRSRSRPA